MKGIILAGGKGTRLYPLTIATSKQLLPIYDKPMIYYPLCVLLHAGIRDILIISTAEDLPRFEHLLGDGSRLGISLSYAVQEDPRGIADAFLVGEYFIGNDPVTLILGDNIYHGPNMDTLFGQIAHLQSGGIVYGYEVNDPSRYGVLTIDDDGRVINITEKPEFPSSPFAVTGLYAYDNQVVDIAKSLEPSYRGELEITDVNNAYLAMGQLHVHLLERGYAWLDTGTHEALHHASNYVQTIQERQGIQIGCVEAVAHKQGFITDEELAEVAEHYSSSSYGNYLRKVLSVQAL